MVGLADRQHVGAGSHERAGDRRRGDLGVRYRDDVRAVAVLAPALDRREPAEHALGSASGATVLTVSALANSRSRSSSGRPIVRSVVFRIATRSHSRSASSRRCVVRKIVTPLLPEPGDQLVDVSAGDRIEPGGRLVEEQHLGVAQQRSRERDPLAQTLGQRRRRDRAPARSG